MANQHIHMKGIVISTVAAGAFLAVPNVTDAALGDQTLRLGMDHPEVKELQEALRKKGYFTHHTSTGYFGEITRQALMKFQRDHKIQQTGVAGPLTLAALLGTSDKQVSVNETTQAAPKSAPSPAPSQAAAPVQLTQLLRVGSSGQAVTELQNQLRAAGVFNQEATGYFGEVTKKAVEQFQNNNNLTVDGIVGPQTWSRLSGVKSEERAVQQVSNSNTSPNPTATPPAAAPQPTQPEPLIKIGTSGQAVTQLQNNLASAGHFNRSATGYFGTVTEEAIRSFQREQGLTANGLYTVETAAQLTLVLNTKSGSANEEAPAQKKVDAFNMIADAAEYVGVPYIWGGTTPAGFDCSGFLMYVFNKQDVKLPRTVAEMWNKGSDASELRVGDLVFFETYTTGPSHAGIYIGNNNFIHSGSSTGVTVSNLHTKYWSDRYLGAKRMF
ncbi:peptidoglycan-binding protein [Anaerobacillus sp. MEB173]|uniref:C40 family peptidase n=1 Tax=Anaerobacillus sp. MEB173 TaxID=3383345 RepID=UPI003F91FCA0